MGETLYLAIMVGVIVLVAVVCVPPLLRRKCPECGARNSLDAVECRTCRAPFSQDDTG